VARATPARKPPTTPAVSRSGPGGSSQCTPRQPVTWTRPSATAPRGPAPALSPGRTHQPETCAHDREPHHTGRHRVSVHREPGGHSRPACSRIRLRAMTLRWISLVPS
jgi:hypothetical protein